MIESLDLFLLACHLKMETAEVANLHTEVANIAWGAPILVLKSKPIGDVCIFLKSGKCSIREFRPRACRLYPLSVGPDNDMKNLIALKSSERDFHYIGQEHRVSDWIADNMNGESQDYVITECRLLREMGRILRCIPRNLENDVKRLMLLNRYLMFDTDSDFMSQYIRNMERLKRELENLAKR